MENQHRTFVWILIGLGFEMGGWVGWEEGREGGREEGYRFIKILAFWFLSTKQTKHTNSSMESVKKTSLTYRAQKEENSVLSFKPGGENAVYRLCWFSLSFFFLFLFVFFVFVFIKESATCFCGSVSRAWIN